MSPCALYLVVLSILLLRCIFTGLKAFRLFSLAFRVNQF